NTLLGNLNDKSTKEIKSNPSACVAIILYGREKCLLKENPSLAKDIEHFIKSLGYTTWEGRNVQSPTLNIVPKTQVCFAKPFPYLLLNLPEALHCLLLWQQTFTFQIKCGCNAELALEPRRQPITIIPNLHARSWIIVNFTGPYITSEPLCMINALCTITTTLLNDQDFLVTTNNHLATCSIGTTTTE
ncbi:hypothetical protein L208DRAFT_1522292, partial [Tricholoma matsutake]